MSTGEDRTVIIADDGRYVTLGRYSQPSEDELQAARDALAKQGIGAWLATMHGTFYQRRAPKLTMIRELVPPRVTWDAAVAAFKAAHKASLANLA